MVMQSQKFGIITTIAALLLVTSAVSTITPYSVSATNNAQISGADNSCPTEYSPFFIGVHHQVSANCLNDLNSVQDSDGASIASTPFNAAPSQAIDVEIGERTPAPVDIPPPDDVGCPSGTIWDVTLQDDVVVDGSNVIPDGSVVCLRGDSSGSQSATLAGIQGTFPVDAEPLGDPPNECPGDSSGIGVHTSGTAPDPPFFQGDYVCLIF